MENPENWLTLKPQVKFCSPVSSINDLKVCNMKEEKLNSISLVKIRLKIPVHRWNSIKSLVEKNGKRIGTNKILMKMSIIGTPEILGKLFFSKCVFSNGRLEMNRKKVPKNNFFFYWVNDFSNFQSSQNY